MSDKPLRECPFCGGEAALDYGFDGGVFIECHTCHASTNIRHSEMDDARELVRAAWNSHPTASILARVPEGLSLYSIQVENNPMAGNRYRAKLIGSHVWKDAEGVGDTPESAVSDAAGRIGGSK